MTSNLIQTAQNTQQSAMTAAVNEGGKRTVNAIMNSMLDSEGMRKRFDDLLGKRSAQFVSSLVSLVNADAKLQEAFYKSPMTVIQSGLKAASYDLPIDPALGFAYIVPFNKRTKDDSGWHTVPQAQFIIGYKGLVQLCLRTGAYSRIPDAVDVREGELISYDRLTGDAEFRWIEDEDEREKLPVIGYVGYFRLKNGAEKTLYMTVKQIKAHELKNRKGDKSKPVEGVWKEDFDAMAKKTVIRRLINHYGLMSIDYQNGDEATVKAAQAIMEDNSDQNLYVNASTGEIIEAEIVEE